MPCDKCKVDFSAREAVAKCADCELAFHPTCARNFNKKIKSWKCESCKDDSGSTVSAKSLDESGEDKRAILEAINSVKKDLSVIDAKIVSVQGSIDLMRTDLKSLSEKVEDIDGRQRELQGWCDQLEQADAALRGETRELRLQIQDLEQHSRCANLEILGLPVTEGEQILALLCGVAAAVNVPFKKEDISMAHRLRLFSKKHAHPPIIVQFVSRIIKESWLRASRQKKTLRASEVSKNFPSSAVFINEHLTSNNKALLGRARRLYREKKIHFAGFFNGKVVVKPREGEEVVRVVWMSDLDRYDQGK